jgi:hypothetical protein
MINWLAENSLTIWMLGAVALTMAFVVYFQTRTNGALYGVMGVILATALLLLASWLLETPREAVERSLYELAATVEANDVKGTLSYLAPSVDKALRKNVEDLMPLVKIERARILGSPQIDVASGPNPTSATVECHGVILAVNRKDGMKGAGQDELILKWVRHGDRWLLESYTSKRDWNRAVGH